GEAASALADHGGDLPRPLERALELDVEGDQRSPGADEHGSRAIVEPPRAVVGRELARVDAALELVRAAAAEKGRATPAPHLAVEEGRQAGLVPDARGRRERRLAGPRHVARLEGNDRDDVGGADPRVRAGVRAEVDPLPGALDPGDERPRELLC